MCIGFESLKIFLTISYSWPGLTLYRDLNGNIIFGVWRQYDQVGYYEKYDKLCFGLLFSDII